MEPREERSSGHTGDLLIFLGPALALLFLTAVTAGLAALSGWYPAEMAAIAAVCGALVAIAAMWLAFRQSRGRAAANRALEDVQARVTGIVESAMDPIITIDEQQRVVLFNAAAEKAFRWPRTAVIGQGLDMLLPERFRAAHGAHVRRFGQTGVTSRRMGEQMVLWGLRADGEEFPIEASISQHEENGRRLFTVILRDVSARQRSEDELARSEARLRGILDSAMDAIITVDESQKVVLFNKAAEDVFGCPRAEAIGAPLAWFIPERFRSGHERLVREFGTTGTTSRRMGGQRVVTGLRRNGEEFPIDASISHITENGAMFYTVILRDVTERVRGEQALERSKDELRELAAASNSVREQEKSRIARELHDELGQALTALKMDVQWLKERSRDETIATKLEAMQRLLDATVASTRRISSDLRPLMLDDLGLMPAVDWLVQNFRQRTGVEVEFAAPELELEEPYATAVFRILQESLTNVARHAQATVVEIELEATNEEVRVSVRDNGVGFRTDEAQRKRGSYGLMGVAERAYLLGGKVDLHSEKNRGTSIDVRIPRPATERQTA
jgi:PAS domain S-box-containing protein